MWHIVWNASRHVFSSCNSEARLAYFCSWLHYAFQEEKQSVQRPKKHRKFFSFRNELGNTFKLPFLVCHDLCFKSRSLHLGVLPSTSLLSQDPRRPRTRKERCCLRRRTGRRCCEILFGLQIRSLLAGGSNTYQSYVDLRTAFFPISWDFLCGMQGRRVVSRGHWVNMGQWMKFG